eukprot:TRINITY_DN9036_c0_g1_i1.p1 TRINITY_DN9036_c0_g1~~TRINITY_DN9036_c0_g1_i1.p1  ORF type:complete len:143 (+),score=24.96 TRINITY_DN9036_c0_g1_i1:57-485(+)
MGCCFSGDGENGEGGGLLKHIARSEIQTVDIVTPVTLEVPIQYKSKVKVRLYAKDDKGRTVEISWLDMHDKKLFDESLTTLFGTRFMPQNELSKKGWKTSSPFEAAMEVSAAGLYHLVVRSSSVLTDKNVRIVGKIIKDELR